MNDTTSNRGACAYSTAIVIREHGDDDGARRMRDDKRRQSEDGAGRIVLGKDYALLPPADVSKGQAGLRFFEPSAQWPRSENHHRASCGSTS